MIVEARIVSDVAAAAQDDADGRAELKVAKTRDHPVEVRTPPDGHEDLLPSGEGPRGGEALGEPAQPSDEFVDRCERVLVTLGVDDPLEALHATKLERGRGGHRVRDTLCLRLRAAARPPTGDPQLEEHLHRPR